MEYLYIEIAEKQPRWFTMRIKDCESTTHEVSDIYTDKGLIRNVDGVNSYWRIGSCESPLTMTMELVEEFIPHMVLYIHTYRLTNFQTGTIVCQKIGDTQYAMASPEERPLIDILKKRKEVVSPLTIVL